MKIQLLKPHTHFGRDYPAGVLLDMDKDAAEWLIRMGVAKPAPKTHKDGETK